MKKAADERADAVDAKLAEIAAAQRQIGEQVAGLRADLGGALKQSAAETEKALDRVRVIQSSVSACATAIQAAMDSADDANKADKVNVANTADNKSASGDAEDEPSKADSRSLGSASEASILTPFFALSSGQIFFALLKAKLRKINSQSD